MKRLCFSTAVLTVCFASAVGDLSAQQNEESPAQVKIESFDWYSQREVAEPRMVKNLYSRRRGDVPTANIPPDYAPPTSEPEKFVYRLTIRNLGKFDITRVVWRYEFINPLTGATAASIEFENRTRIKPNKRKTLYADSISLPAQTVDVGLLLLNPKQPYLESVSIQSVIYDENSKRRGSGVKKIQLLK